MRLADRISVPNAAIFLVAAGILVTMVDALGDALTIEVVEHIGVIALIVILFDGACISDSRASVAILALGVLGTFATAGGLVTLAAHYLLDFSWIASGLIGAAIAPTDPAVTFSVLGARDPRPHRTILEGEAGTNDSVGIALMIGMIELATEEAAASRSWSRSSWSRCSSGLPSASQAHCSCSQRLGRIHLASLALYPIRVLAGAGVIYGIASVTHGSGFLFIGGNAYSSSGAA
jgi:cell volume regulation protein A